jgi:hypothetical protein
VSINSEFIAALLVVILSLTDKPGMGGHPEGIEGVGALSETLKLSHQYFLQIVYSD